MSLANGSTAYRLYVDTDTDQVTELSIDVRDNIHLINGDSRTVTMVTSKHLMVLLFEEDRFLVRSEVQSVTHHTPVALEVAQIGPVILTSGGTILYLDLNLKWRELGDGYVSIACGHRDTIYGLKSDGSVHNLDAEMQAVPAYTLETGLTLNMEYGMLRLVEHYSPFMIFSPIGWNENVIVASLFGRHVVIDEPSSRGQAIVKCVGLQDVLYVLYRDGLLRRFLMKPNPRGWGVHLEYELLGIESESELNTSLSDIAIVKLIERTEYVHQLVGVDREGMLDMSLGDFQLGYKIPVTTTSTDIYIPPRQSIKRAVR